MYWDYSNVFSYWIPIDVLTTVALFAFYYYHKTLFLAKEEANKGLSNKLKEAIAVEF
jgi:hypothetical protein